MIWEIIIILVFYRIIQVCNLKCYACITDDDENCKNEVTNKTPICINSEVKEELKQAFNEMGNGKIKLNGESCISLEFKITEDTSKYMRTCIPAKDCTDESIKTFASISGYGKIEFCSICFTDFCNYENLLNTGDQLKSSVILISTFFLIKLLI